MKVKKNTARFNKFYGLSKQAVP